MNVTVHPSTLEGQVNVPPSKSIFQRLVACALLANGTSRISNPSFSADGITALHMAGSLGADIMEDGDEIIISGKLNPRAQAVSAGESGLGIRLFTPIAALCSQKITLAAEGSLASRPMDTLVYALSQVGVKCKTTQGLITVQGPMQGGKIQMQGGISSQFVTGLLTALPRCLKSSEITMDVAVSKPYIDLTIEILADFGVEVNHDDYVRFTIQGNQQFRPGEFETEGDWSAAATLLVAGAVAGGSGFSVAGLGGTLSQADKAVTGALMFSGARMSQENGIYQLKAHKLNGFEFDATHCPDLFPPLAALAVFGNRPTSIKGLGRLKHKESDRGLTIQSEFQKAGIQVDLSGDIMIIHPGVVNPCTINSHGDHRIVMAGAILGLGGAPVTIENAEAVTKSYPQFFEDLASLGARLKW